ncbi:type IV toxin-antitoxin system AbiEi family antitoxin domain-containing protein [Kribbella sp. VKM Ac-2568]|uniref:type IV toxin-antitoxin system AbiEi family antitoxin domain-containing protein n=1 Tax=Kribbella sp. VKM Ac-2568 TaxID=2512219 RepID=UPI0010E62464|nr:type IV toxin-antitoxin system AbiEi family antitoxin domain-containing protein [Kribbella sp. VKM Ac-2568]TCM51371.1 putative AbiEi antitoxin of type IV toxin-antitoxin system [Kribbella sp. VKM Ac-2568]
MESVPNVVACNRGNATFAELVEATSRRALAAAVKAGQVERVARGIYVLPGDDNDRRTALAYDGVVSHLSAAVAWDLPLLSLPPKPAHHSPDQAPSAAGAACCAALGADRSR